MLKGCVLVEHTADRATAEQKQQKERESEEERNSRHQWHATKHLTWNLDRFYNRSVF